MYEEKVCSNCSYTNETEESSCRFCGHSLDEMDAIPEQNLVLATEKATVAREAVSFVNIIIGLIIFFFVVGIILMPNMNRGSSRRRARLKACIANMRVLHGAVEMYNMDNTQVIKHLDHASMQKLLSGKYLRQEPVCYSDPPGIYSSTGDLTQTGLIRCSVHGTVEEPIEDF